MKRALNTEQEIYSGTPHAQTVKVFGDKYIESQLNLLEIIKNIVINNHDYSKEKDQNLDEYIIFYNEKLKLFSMYVN